MVARLVAEEGDLKGLVLSLEQGDSWVIGRDPDVCQLVIEDPQTSRRHLVAHRTEQGIVVENLSTTNPIQVNDEEIGTQPRLLQQGDTIRIGNEVFRFYTDTSVHIVDEQLGSTPSGEAEAYVASPPLNRSIQKEDNQDDILDEDTIFDENFEDDRATLAEINFGLAETGRWLLKVVGGPNNGAEFYMQTGHQYLLGTDPQTCDIVFHDTSVSRQHARITVTQEDILLIEDLKSRNGVLVSGEPIEEGKHPLSLSVIVTLGTTSFVVYDREGEMQTIISPLLPSIVKTLKQEEAPKVEEPIPAPIETVPVSPAIAETSKREPKKPFQWGPVILLSVISGLFILAGLGTASLFKTEPVVITTQEDADELLKQALTPFPNVKYSFNKASGSLLLLGHVSTAMDKNQLMYNLQGLKFIKSIDDSGIIIDEYVWQEFNLDLARNPSWRGITVHSPTAGQFILSGYLQTNKQADQLSDYMSVHFPYLDRLKKQIVVEEDVISRVNIWLQQQNFNNIIVKMGNNGEITLTGAAPSDKAATLNELMTKIKGIPGVRSVQNLIRMESPRETGIVNLTGQYEITGQSKIGNNYTVIINGRILSEGDSIDNMRITSIRPNAIFLERDGTKYRIDYK